MSHVVAIETEIHSLDSLADACKELGLELALGQTTYRWYGRHVGDYPMPAGFTAADLGKCTHAVRIPSSSRAYEVGVVPRRDGRPGWTLLFDFWSGGYGMADKVGQRCEKLLQAYGVAHVMRTMSRTHRIQRRKLQDGTVELTLRRA